MCAVVRSVWSAKMPLANTPAILCLLDGPVDVDPAFYLVWSRFRMMRRYLAYCPEEEPRIFRMLDLISRGAPGHGPVHLLLISAAEIGFAWDAGEQGWIRVSLPPLRMMAGPIQHFRSAVLDAWHFHVLSRLAERKGFWGAQFADIKGSSQLLNSTHLRDRDKMLLRAIMCGGVWNGFLLGKAKKEDVPCRFCGKRDGDGHLFWECSFLPFSMCVISLSFPFLCPWIVVDARRRLLQARGYWYPVIADLHRFMIAIARVSLNHDGKSGTAPDPLVWDKGSRPKVRRLDIRVNVDLASLPGPPGFLNSDWVQIGAGPITRADISAWLYSVGTLVRFTSFLSHLHWPSGSVDMGHFGVSFLELLILFEQWAGHRLLSEKVTRPHVRAGRPISVSSVPVSEGIEIRHGCQFLSSLVRALGKLPGGLVRFLPCQVGSHFSRLRHLGWNQCSHGLTSRPLESCHHLYLSAICGGFGVS